MKKRVLALIMVMAMAGSLTATVYAADDSSSESSDDVIKVRVAGLPEYKPYTYVDENENLTGYDIEVLKAIDEIAPEIECEFSYTQWDSMLPGLDADKYDVVTCQIYKSDEREEMYLYPKYPFLYAGSAIISNKDDPMDSLDDLKGKKVGAIVGDSTAALEEEYLEENPDAFTIEYMDGTTPQMLDGIINGRVDATINDPFAARSIAEEAGIADRFYFSDEMCVGEFAYFLLAKTDKGQQIADVIDKYLPQLYYDGTLAKLAKEYLGSDSGVTGMPENGVFEEDTLEDFQANEK